MRKECVRVSLSLSLSLSARSERHSAACRAIAALAAAAGTAPHACQPHGKQRSAHGPRAHPPTWHCTRRRAAPLRAVCACPQPVSMLVGCVDNMEARQLMEQVSEELQLPFMDAVVSDDAMGGSVQLIIPGRTGGLEAAPIKSHMEKRAGSCAASLPTTDSIIAGITGQNILKYLLGFGEVAFRARQRPLAAAVEPSPATAAIEIRRALRHHRMSSDRQPRAALPPPPRARSPLATPCCAGSPPV